jgi:hypothetical protein
MERDDEIKGSGNSYTAEFWQYDSRLGRRWNIDPVYKHNYSNYSAFSNNPIIFIDPKGDDDYYSQDGTFLRTDGKKTNFVWVEINGKNYKLDKLTIAMKNSPGNLQKSAALKIINNYAVNTKATRIVNDVNVMHTDKYDNISVHAGAKYGSGKLRFKLHEVLNDANNITNVFVHEEVHVKNNALGYGEVKSELLAVQAQINHDSYEGTTKEFKEYLINSYAGYYLTKTGSEFKEEFEKKNGIEIKLNDNGNAEWNYVDQ